jgi:group I intron endonuclease
MILGVSHKEKELFLTKKSKKFGIVYKIKNNINSDFYIGSTCNLYKRYYTHLRDIRSNKKTCVKLVRAANKYDEDNFEFNIIAKCPPEYVLKLEQWFLDNLKPKYNVAKVAGSNEGIKRTEECKKAKAIQQKEKWLDENYRNHHLESLSNNWKSGSGHRMAKINEQVAKEVKDLIKLGKSCKEIKELKNISIHIVKDIKRGKTWKN